MRKLNITLIAFLAIVLCGLCTYTVYATVQSQIKLSNTISFDAVGVFYTADVRIYYEDNQEVLATDSINNSGEKLDDEEIPAERHEMNFNTTPFNFSRTHRAIVYEIVIKNYTETAVDVTVAFDEIASENRADYVVDTFNIGDGESNQCTLSAKQLRGSANGVTFHITSTAKSLKNSFLVHNNLIVTLDKVSS